MIEIINKKDCCWCNACLNICGKKAITTLTDEEGFQYPHIEKRLCVDCGFCEKVCPILNVIHETKYEKQKGYLLQIKDEKIDQEQQYLYFHCPCASRVLLVSDVSR